MHMQETVIRFGKAMQTKLKVKHCISQSPAQSLYIAKESCFSRRGFSSLTVDLSLDFVVFVRYLKCFTFGYITNDTFCGQSAELYLKSIVT